MSGAMDKAKGVGNELVGGAKRKIGEAAGSDRLEAEGAVQELKGKVQKKVGEAKDAAQGAANRLDDAANRNR
jgi:uncharacterized protein YjbJ (UPF0337 family)